MTSLRNIRRLIDRSAAGVQRCDMQSSALERRRQELAQEMASTRQQQDGLRQLIKLGRPQGALDINELFSCQRRIASFQLKISEQEIRHKQLLRQDAELEQQLTTLRSERTRWLRKQEKYQTWADKSKKALRLASLRLEEAEAQEVITWKL